MSAILDPQKTNHPLKLLKNQELQHEHQRAVFRAAAGQIHHEFEEATWQAFWLTAVEGKPVGDVADELGKSPGAVYTSRSRVMRRLMEKVREFGW